MAKKAKIDLSVLSVEELKEKLDHIKKNVDPIKKRLRFEEEYQHSYCLW